MSASEEPSAQRPFQKRGEREIWRGAVISLAEGTFASPSGVEFQREIVHHPGAVCVVPVDGDEVVLVRQYRAAEDEEILEIPAGKRDVEGEAPETTANRELEEEHMTIERIRLDDVPALIAAGELVDAKTVIGLLLARERLG